MCYLSLIIGDLRLDSNSFEDLQLQAKCFDASLNAECLSTNDERNPKSE
jgi:hypothetical protein